MLCLYTAFDNRERPLETFIKSHDKIINVKLYQSNTGLSLYQISEYIEKINQLINKNNDHVLVNDVKSHLNHFKFNDLNRIFNVVDCDASFEGFDDHHNEWNRLISKVSEIYNYWECRGLHIDSYPIDVKWSLDTYTGRSKSKLFNVQGATEEYRIYNPDAQVGDLFVHFDWVAADMRIAACLSNDEHLLELIDHDDVYQNIADKLNLTRDECKIRLLSAINSMNVSDSILANFSGLRNWISESLDKIQNGMPLCSILGRKFYVKDVDKFRAPFNATMQGSIVHAMQSSMVKIWKLLAGKLFTEIHDSLVVTVSKDQLKSAIQDVVNIMRYPFDGLLEYNPRFYISVSIGNHWRKWNKLGVF